jgi:hypothetical protein
VTRFRRRSELTGSVGEEGGRLTVAVPNGNAFTQDQLKSPASRELLVAAARRVRPELRDVVLTTAAVPPAGADRTAVEHPLVQAAMELFNGEVTAVRPLGAPPARGPAEVADPAPRSGEPT